MLSSPVIQPRLRASRDAARCPHARTARPTCRNRTGTRDNGATAGWPPRAGRRPRVRRAGPGGGLASHGPDESPQRSRPVPAVRVGTGPPASPRPDRSGRVSCPTSSPAPGLDAASEEYGEKLPQGRFLDRERSWLAFNERVLELAEDPATPLLERANFLAIFASNLDEFFMVRVAGLKRRMATGVATRSASGLQPRDVLDLILTRSRELMARHAACFQNDVGAAARRRGHPRHPLGRADREGAGPAVHPVPAADLPGAHPAGRRPRAPLPVHLRACRSTWPSSSATRSPATSTSPG